MSKRDTTVTHAFYYYSFITVVAVYNRASNQTLLAPQNTKNTLSSVLRKTVSAAPAPLFLAIRIVVVAPPGLAQKSRTFRDTPLRVCCTQPRTTPKLSVRR